MRSNITHNNTKYENQHSTEHLLSEPNHEEFNFNINTENIISNSTRDQPQIYSKAKSQNIIQNTKKKVFSTGNSPNKYLSKEKDLSNEYGNNSDDFAEKNKEVSSLITNNNEFYQEKNVNQLKEKKMNCQIITYPLLSSLNQKKKMNFQKKL